MAMAGDGLEQLIKQHLVAHKPDVYTLVEIGSANCVSLRAFRDILAENAKTPWRVVGFDLPPGKAWSLDLDEARKAFDGLPYQVFTDESTFSRDILRDAPLGMSLYLASNPRARFEEGWQLPTLSFVFVDGCHGKCAGRDFLAVEKLVMPGGLVAFHDYGEQETGTDYQSHCREFISVRSYVHRLGLNQPGPGVRKGWRWVGEIKGSRHWGGDGNSVAVVQRTEEPLQHQPELSLD
jgi:hypothetical protein